MQIILAVKQNKTINGPRVRGISPVGKEKVCGEKDFPKSQILSSEWKTERVREDASGDREDGEEDDDELPCVIGENEGDCIHRGSRRSVASSIQTRSIDNPSNALPCLSTLQIDMFSVMPWNRPSCFGLSYLFHWHILKAT